jgi:hypothetical protein
MNFTMEKTIKEFNTVTILLTSIHANVLIESALAEGKLVSSGYFHFFAHQER